MKQFSSPVRRLEGVTYWVIEDCDGIYDFINTEIRKEWEADARSEGRNPQDDPWLKALSKCRWSLEIVPIARIKLNPAIMSYVDSKSGYNFQENLAKRSRELQTEIQEFSTVIWPLIVSKEGFMLVDGYCRYTTLKAIGVSKTYAYTGAI